MNKKSKKIALKPFEIVWYSLNGLLGLWGLTYIILGLIANYSGGINGDNPIKGASNALKETFGLDFFYWGIILVAIAAFLSVVVLCIYGKSSDAEAEKAQRRAARLNQEAAVEEAKAE